MKKTTAIPTILIALASLFAIQVNAQDSTTFQDFLAQFPTASLPYNFSTEELQSQLQTRTAAKAKRLGWEYYQFLPELERSAQFSSMPVYPEPVAKFETENNIAVLYNIARGLSRGTKTYSITIFDKEGNYIGTHFVAGVNPNTITVATIAENLNATVKEYKVNWASDFRTKGTQDNQVIGLELTESQMLDLVAPGNPDQIEWTNTNTVQDTTADLAKMK
ncbi:MAG: hypothetical protein DYG98_06560 [Haliscomenobacteraceae bacterium CHB4]|nr:hypothetical protein [Saprospiraceae bacterium]MCE7922699.1 hypothetical protein [Haliscomenobacteraceae bacterium CHB4]